jgi:putative restriction endonuclease
MPATRSIAWDTLPGSFREYLLATGVEPGSLVIVTNGIALCALHHAAFDGLLFGIRPDYNVVVRTSILEEEDGPMLKHGLQGLHGSRLIVPRKASQRPDPRLLERRWERFRAVA